MFYRKAYAGVKESLKGLGISGRKEHGEPSRLPNRGGANMS